MPNDITHINKVAIIGSGSFGTALAVACSNSGKTIHLWGRSKEIISGIQKERTNERYLKGVYIPENVVALNDLDEAVTDADLIFLSVPSFSIIEILNKIGKLIGDSATVVNCVKGFIPESCQTVSEYCEVYKKKLQSNWRIAKLAGPNIARDLVRDTPSGSVLACRNFSVSRIVSKELSSKNYRLYHSSDIEAVELASILKNIYAIGLGFASEFSHNINTQSLLFTRSISEMMQIYKSKNLDYASLLGLAGVGDFYASCTDKSRNYRLGKNLATGMALSTSASDHELLAEGRYSIKYFYPQLTSEGLYLPIMECIHGYMFEKYSLSQVLRILSELPVFQKDVEI